MTQDHEAQEWSEYAHLDMWRWVEKHRSDIYSEIFSGKS